MTGIHNTRLRVTLLKSSLSLYERTEIPVNNTFHSFTFWRELEIKNLVRSFFFSSSSLYLLNKLRTLYTLQSLSLSLSLSLSIYLSIYLSDSVSFLSAFPMQHSFEMHAYKSRLILVCAYLYAVSTEIYRQKKSNEQDGNPWNVDSARMFIELSSLCSVSSCRFDTATAHSLDDDFSLLFVAPRSSITSTVYRLRSTHSWDRLKYFRTDSSNRNES